MVMVIQTCNPVFWRLGKENQELEASLGYKVRPCFKKKFKPKQIIIIIKLLFIIELSFKYYHLNIKGCACARFVIGR